MKVKTSELIGPALDWAVAQATGTKPVYTWRAFGVKHYGAWETAPAIGPAVMLRPYSTDWAQGGPIIEREGIQINFMRFDSPPYWTAHAEDLINKMRVGAWAPTPLIAAMRCFVSSKLGDEVDVPEELT